MSTATIIQVGDVHYPEWDDGAYKVDSKDEKLSASVRSGVTHSPMRLVLSKLNEISGSTHTNAVAFMGDFTSWGGKMPLEAALNHMSWLCRINRVRGAQPTLMLVPGNHDVAKKDAVDFGQIGKFQNMADIAERNFFEKMPVELHVPISITSKIGKVQAFLLNTTLGSWEPYLLPKALSEAVEADSEKVAGADISKALIAPAGAAPEASLQYYDQLDTPYVSSRALSDLREAVRKTARTDAIVVIGHHNLLPQEQPRLSSYAEMLNAGFFRRFLLSLERPIVYLHGHTHKDTVEVISDPRNPKSKIICIAAPKLEDGFNEISFHFDQRSNALGLRLLPWRLSPDGSAFSPSIKDQAAWGLLNNALRPSKQSSELFDVLLGNREDRFNLIDVEDLASELPKNELEALLLELYFWRWIDIDRVAASKEEWIIQMRRHKL